jgi:predicted nucleic acid-binding protein
MNAVDTNIVVYSFDVYSPVKQQRAGALLSTLLLRPQESVLLWQVAAEVLNCLRRWQAAGRMSVADVEAHTHDTLKLFSLVTPSEAVIKCSLNLTTRYSLSHWDSMLVAAAIEAGVTTLYTEDLQAGAVYDGVRIINPLA